MDTMALNSEYVGTMQQAIETYITDVETAIANIKAFEIGSDSGFYGTAQCTTINGYVSETCEQINKIVRYFDDFKKALDEVAGAYSDQSAATTVGEVEVAAENEGDLVNVNRMQ
jgi:hypothetical protein